jgi:plastocyanin
MRAIIDLFGHRARGATLAAATAAIGLLAVLLLLGSGSAAGAAPTASASKSVTVSMKNFSFKPATVHISKGDRVVWANLDGVRHTATKAGSFDTGKIKSGKAVAVKFGAKGTYRYHCSLHPEMIGKVVVGG